MSKVHYGSRYVYSMQYPLVWCVKYRKDILHGQIDHDVKKLLRLIATDNDVSIVEMESGEDHFHLLIECKPQHYIPDVVKALKTISARILFKKHPKLKQKLWKGHLWIPSYFVATASENTAAHIRTYIQSQKRRQKVRPMLRHKEILVDVETEPA